MLATLVIKRGTKIRLVTWVPAFAMIGVFVGSLSNAGLKVPIRDGVDSNVTVITQRVFTVAFVLLVLVIVSRVRERRRRRGNDSPYAVRITWRTGWLLGVIGVIDAVSFISFGYGLAYSPAWLIAIISQNRTGDSRCRRGDVRRRLGPRFAVDVVQGWKQTAVGGLILVTTPTSHPERMPGRWPGWTGRSVC